MRRVVHQAKAHQSPVPNVECQILHVAEPLRNSINCVNCASCACPFTVIVCRLDGWDWLGQAALLRSACIELVGDKSHGLINSHHSRGFDKVWPVASSCSTGIICNQCPSPVWNNWNVARTPTSPTRPWMANDETRWSWRYNSIVIHVLGWDAGYIKYHQITQPASSSIITVYHILICVSCGVLAFSLASSFTFGILTGYWHVRTWFDYMIIS